MIRRFEDLPVWQDARKLTKEVYMVTEAGNFKNDFRLKGQLQASSVSIMSNIAEGFENQTTKQFIRYLYISRGSAGELRSQLYVAYDIEYISKKVLLDLKGQASFVSKQCNGFINYLENYRPPSDRVQEIDEDAFLKILSEYYEEDV